MTPNMVFHSSASSPIWFPSIFRLHLFSLRVVHVSVAGLILSGEWESERMLHVQQLPWKVFKRQAVKITFFLLYSNIYQGLRTGLDIIFSHFSFKKCVDMPLFWNNDLSKKKGKSSCFSPFETNLTKVSHISHSTLNASFSSVWGLEQHLFFVLALDTF